MTVQPVGEKHAHYSRTAVYSLVPFILSLFVVGLGFIPVLKPEAALATGIGAPRVYELALVMAGSLLVIVPTLIKGTPVQFGAPPVAFALAFGLWCLLSSLWSLAPILTVSKSLELLTIIVYAVFFSQAFTAQRLITRDLALILMTSCVALAAAVLVANLALWGTPLAMADAGEFVPRLRLRTAYGHPFIVADICSIGIIATLATRLRYIYTAPILFGFGILLLKSDARTAIVAITIAILTIILLRQRAAVCALVLYLALTLTTIGLLIRATLNHGALQITLERYLPRDAITLNSRTEVWHVVLTAIGTQPILGHGYYASRYIILDSFSWAGDAHNIWLEILLSVGLLGLVIALLFIAASIQVAVLTRNEVAIGLTMYFLLVSITTTTLLVPELPFVFYLVAIATCDHLRKQQLHHRSLSDGNSMTAVTDKLGSEGNAFRILSPRRDPGQRGHPDPA